jgi:hypothetical protein
MHECTNLFLNFLILISVTRMKYKPETKNKYMHLNAFYFITIFLMHRKSSLHKCIPIPTYFDLKDTLSYFYYNKHLIPECLIAVQEGWRKKYASYHSWPFCSCRKYSLHCYKCSVYLLTIMGTLLVGKSSIAMIEIQRSSKTYHRNSFGPSISLLSFLLLT